MFCIYLFINSIHTNMRKYIYIALVLTLSISCKKHKLKNAENGWSITEIIVNDLDYTSVYRNIVSEEVVYFRKKNEYAETIWYVQTGQNQTNGTWEFKEGKKKLEILRDGGYAELWEVEELKSKKMKLRRVDEATGWSYVIEYKKN